MSGATCNVSLQWFLKAIGMSTLKLRRQLDIKLQPAKATALHTFVFNCLHTYDILCCQVSAWLFSGESHHKKIYIINRPSQNPKSTLLFDWLVLVERQRWHKMSADFRQELRHLHDKGCAFCGV